MQFKPDQKTGTNIEKQKPWDEWLKKIDRIIDGGNYPIDSGIKEAVIAFNVHGFNTDASCEGHMDRGLPYPWVDISAISEDAQKEFKKGHETIASRKYKNEKDFENSDPELYKKMMEIREKRLEESKKIKYNLEQLLNEFYSSHKPYSPDGIIKTHEFGNGFRVELEGSRGLGLSNWRKFDEKIAKLNQREKEAYLKNNQNEMKAFTQFLKSKFFEGK